MNNNYKVYASEDWVENKLKDLNTSAEPAGESLGLVKSGGDVTITDGIIKINDNFSYTNINGLQDALNTTESNAKTYAESKLTEAKEYTDSKSLPIVSTNDNGKFLRVVDGLWDAVVVPNAEEASF